MGHLCRRRPCRRCCLRCCCCGYAAGSAGPAEPGWGRQRGMRHEAREGGGRGKGHQCHHLAQVCKEGVQGRHVGGWKLRKNFVHACMQAGGDPLLNGPPAATALSSTRTQRPACPPPPAHQRRGQQPAGAAPRAPPARPCCSPPAAGGTAAAAQVASQAAAAAAAAMRLWCCYHRWSMYACCAVGARSAPQSWPARPVGGVSKGKRGAAHGHGAFTAAGTAAPRGAPCGTCCSCPALHPPAAPPPVPMPRRRNLWRTNPARADQCCRCCLHRQLRRGPAEPARGQSQMLQTSSARGCPCGRARRAPTR